MARPRVFVSSTYYDLKHVRASLEVFIESLGFDAILFEKGDITFHPDQALDESCYREAKSADIFVLIVGGRYGSVASSEEADLAGKLPKRYESITRKEFDAAQESEVPTFILIDGQVHSEYSTYRKNRDNKSIVYAHVDSVSVFHLIEWIYSKKNNNPIYTFDRATDISGWLREQWAGLFRELLHARSQQQQLANLNSQVSQLASLNSTFKTYLEAVLSSVSPEGSKRIISDEDQKLAEQKIASTFEHNPMYYSFLQSEVFAGALRKLIESSSNWKTIVNNANELLDNESGPKFVQWLLKYPEARKDFNKMRSALGLAAVRWPKSVLKDSIDG